MEWGVYRAREIVRRVALIRLHEATRTPRVMDAVYLPQLLAEIRKRRKKMRNYREPEQEAN